MATLEAAVILEGPTRADRAAADLLRAEVLPPDRGIRAVQSYTIPMKLFMERLVLRLNPLQDVHLMPLQESESQFMRILIIMTMVMELMICGM